MGVFLFHLYIYISGKAGRELPKSFFTVFHIKEDTFLEKKLQENENDMFTWNKE